MAEVERTAATDPDVLRQELDLIISLHDQDSSNNIEIYENNDDTESGHIEDDSSGSTTSFGEAGSGDGADDDSSSSVEAIDEVRYWFSGKTEEHDEILNSARVTTTSTNDHEIAKGLLGALSSSFPQLEITDQLAGDEGITKDSKEELAMKEKNLEHAPSDEKEEKSAKVLYDDDKEEEEEDEEDDDSDSDNQNDEDKEESVTSHDGSGGISKSSSNSVSTDIISNTYKKPLKDHDGSGLRGRSNLKPRRRSVSRHRSSSSHDESRPNSTRSMSNRKNDRSIPQNSNSNRSQSRRTPYQKPAPAPRGTNNRSSPRHSSRKGNQSDHSSIPPNSSRSLHSAVSSSRRRLQQNGHTPANNSSRSIHSALASSPNSKTSSISSRRSSYMVAESARRASWKSDPKASFSDWRLEISYEDQVNGGQTRIDVYNLHKNVIAFGTRKSDFILQEITELELKQVVLTNNSNHDNNSNSTKSANGSRSTDTVTRITVPTESQAKAVPMVLDFLYYTKEMRQKLTPETSCNVFKVAEILEVHALQKAIGEFYMKNLTLNNLGEFLTAATKTKANKLLTICKAKIGQMITEQPELSGLVPPKFMADILWISSKQLEEARLREPEKYTEELIISQSLYWSKAACICAAANELILTQPLFEKLTAADSLPYVDVSATPKFLSIESRFLGTGDILERSSISSRSHASSSSELTCLQKRCVEAIVNDFEAFQDCFESADDLAESLRHLPSNILAEILLKSRLRSRR